LYITIIVVFLTAFLHVLDYLVLRYTTAMTLLKIVVLFCVLCFAILFVYQLMWCRQQERLVN